MDSRHLMRQRGTTLAVLLGLALLLTPAFGGQASLAEKIDALKKDARHLESKGEWERACFKYEEILRLDRGRQDIRGRYQHALRRLFQTRRHADPTYHNDVLTLKYTQSLRLYEIVLHNLLDGALDKHKLDAGRLVRTGLEELRNALSDPAFCKLHLRGLKPNDTREFRDKLTGWIHATGFLTRDQAVEQIRDVSMKALERLNLNATTTILECTCGACLALDEYTVYLTPGQFRELADLLKGEMVGAGLVLARDNKGLVVMEVQQNSPAADPEGKDGKPTNAIVPGDRVYNIDGKSVTDLSVDAAVRLLEGEVGTTVELTISAGGMMQRAVVLRRRAVQIRSVGYDMLSGAIGYLQITSFQETTLQELDTALTYLKKSEMKALVLDLRDNRGGLLDVAIEVTQKFLANGVILSTQHQDSKLNTVYHARNPAALTVPVVVLVNGQTASAAEIVTGALKDNKRARVVGQTTYGKGCAQGIMKLPSQGLLKVPPATSGPTTGGIRITVARFLSPSGHCYTGRGVVPHVFAERTGMAESMSDDDYQLSVARAEALRLLDMVR